MMYELYMEAGEWVLWRKSNSCEFFCKFNCRQDALDFLKMLVNEPY